MPKRGKRNSTNGANQLARERIAERAQVGDDVAHVGRDEVRQQPAVVQRRAPAHEAGRGTAAARSARPARAAAAICTRLMRGCGGISKARNSSRPRRPVGASGEYSLSMENSARCVLPVRSTSRWRSSRSTSHGRGRLLAGFVRCVHLLERDLELVEPVVARLVHARRLAGRPMNMPENRYESAGWFCQYVTRLCSRSGRRRSGLSAGVAPPSVTWLPPPVPVWRPSSMNFSVAEARCARFLVERRRCWRQARPTIARRVDVDLDDAGIGRHVEHPDARVARRRVALDHDRRADVSRRGLDGREQLDVILEPHQRRHEHVQVAVARLDAQRGLDHVPRRRRRAASAPRSALRCASVARRGSASRERERIDRISGSTSSGRQVRQRRERQPQAERRVARQQVERARAAAAKGCVRHASPASAAGLRAARNGSTKPAGRSSPAASRRASRARSSGFARSAMQRIGVGRQRGFRGQKLRHVLECGDHRGRGRGRAAAASSPRSAARPRGRRRRARAYRRSARSSRQSGCAVGAPADAERPARQRLARIPLALPEVQEPARSRSVPASRRSSSPPSSRFFGDSAV